MISGLAPSALDFCYNLYTEVDSNWKGKWDSCWERALPVAIALSVSVDKEATESRDE